MVCNDIAHYGEAKPRALLFGRKIGFKHAYLIFGRDARAVV